MPEHLGLRLTGGDPHASHPLRAGSADTPYVVAIPSPIPHAIPPTQARGETATERECLAGGGTYLPRATTTRRDPHKPTRGPAQ